LLPVEVVVLVPHLLLTNIMEVQEAEVMVLVLQEVEAHNLVVALVRMQVQEDKEEIDDLGNTMAAAEAAATMVVALLHMMLAGAVVLDIHQDFQM
jgi:hypothetical protein